MQDISAPTRETLVPAPPNTAQHRKRGFAIMTLGFASALGLGLAAGMNVHRLVDLDRTATWLQQTGSILQSGFEATRHEIGSRIASFTSKPVAISGATQPAPWQEPSRDEALVRMVGDLSRRV